MLSKLKDYIKMGDPLDRGTNIGPLAKKSQVDNLVKQVKESVEKGAKIIFGE